MGREKLREWRRRGRDERRGEGNHVPRCSSYLGASVSVAGRGVMMAVVGAGTEGGIFWLLGWVGRLI